MDTYLCELIIFLMLCLLTLLGDLEHSIPSQKVASTDNMALFYIYFKENSIRYVLTPVTVFWLVDWEVFCAQPLTDTHAQIVVSLIITILQKSSVFELICAAHFDAMQ